MKRILFLFAALFFTYNSYTQNMKFASNAYEKEWKEITDLESKGLPKSAMEKVLALYQRAKTDNNAPQIIKTLILRSKYTSQLNEEGFVKAVNELDSEMRVAAFPVQPILQSMLAEMYNGYLANNLWKFRNRTTTVDFKNEDLRTWSAEAITEKATALYRQSLSDLRIKDIPLKNFDAIIRSGDYKLRPTLYHFLAYRTIAFFHDDKSYLSKPAIVFNLDDAKFFAPAKEFIALDLPAKDSSDHAWWAFKLTQEVLKYDSEISEKDKSNPNDSSFIIHHSSFIDADLQRLDYVHSKSNLENKDELYLAALQNLYDSNKENPVIVEIAFRMAQIHRTKANLYTGESTDVALQRLYKNENAVALTILQTAIKKFPDAYQAKACRNLIKEILKPDLSFEIERVNLPDKAILTKVNFKNTPQASLRLIRINGKKPRNYNNDENLEYYRNLPFVKQWTIKLPDDGDHNEHSTEIKIDKLPFGQYVLLSSDNAKFVNKTGGIVCQTGFQVSNMAFFQRKTETAPNEFVVVNRTTGQPLDKVTAEFYENIYNNKTNQNDQIKIGDSVSDKDGFIHPHLTKDKFFTAKFIKGEDVLNSDDGFNEYKNERDTKSYIQTYFFLDRAIYRPGQTIYFKGIVVEEQNGNVNGNATLHIIVGKKIEVTFYDANRQKISSLSLTTNEFGSINGNFTAPSSGLLGEMNIASDKEGSKYFRVEEYKRPKFETKIEPLTGTYTLGQPATIKGTAKAFAGSNVDNAQVKYRVVRNVRFPYWYDYYWRPSWHNSAPVEIAHGETKTDADGKFSIDFEAIADASVPKNSKPTFEFTVYADVVDINGETHSAQQSMSIGYTSLLIDVQTPELMERKNIKPLKIISTNLNGQPLESKGTIKLDLLVAPTHVFNKRDWTAPDTISMNETEFKRDFPDYAYKNEDKKENWITSFSYQPSAFSYQPGSGDSLKKSGDFILPANLKSGTYRLTLETTDATGEKITVIKYFTVYDAKEKAPAQTVLLSQLNKNPYEPGDKAVLNMNTSADYIWVIIEDEWNGKIKNRAWKKISGAEIHNLTIKEEHPGNVFVHLVGVHNNRPFGDTKIIVVPFTNKDLHFTYQTFRDKLLPGSDEEWRITITGEKKEKIAAEMVAAMYDASLDQFAANSWSLGIYPSRYSQLSFNTHSFGSSRSNPFYHYSNEGNEYDAPRQYPSLNWFGFYFNDNNLQRYVGDRIAGFQTRTMSAPMAVEKSKNPPPPPMEMDAVPSSFNIIASDKDKVPDFTGSSIGKKNIEGDTIVSANSKSNSTTDFSQIKSRTNLNETVFFYPNLMTDSAGNVVVKFKMNEALTRWKFLALAHTKDLKVGVSEKSIVTQKDLMIIPNTPRFVREGDAMELSAKVTNLSDKVLNGEAALELFDAITLKKLDWEINETVGRDAMHRVSTFSIKPDESAPLFWKIKIPNDGAQALTLRYVAKAGDFSDGEEVTIPVLTNRQLVTETMPMNVRDGATKTFNFQSLRDADKSPTLTTQKLTLEFTQNPAWYAVQALPYLMEYPYECTEQLFSRYYANTLATNVANTHPKIKAVFDRWRTIDVEALKSNLSKNQKLKTALLEETPWVLQAQSEEIQKKNIGLLFDLNKMGNEAQNAINKMHDRQQPDGGYAWFPGGRTSWFITQYIVCGFGHLKSLGVIKRDIGQQITDDRQQTIKDVKNEMITKAIHFCDTEFEKNYAELEKMFTEKTIKREDDHLSSLDLQYLYAKTFFPDSASKPKTPAYNYFMAQAEKYWLSRSIYEQAMIALIMKRTGKSAVTDGIVASLKERAMNNEELGMYWKSDWGYHWYEQPIETQSMMIELFNEVGDQKAVDDLKVWLLKNKQTNAWKTTKATSEAVYALLKTGGQWLDGDTNVAIKIGGQDLDISQIKKEAGTGYFKTDLVNNGQRTTDNSNKNSVLVGTGRDLSTVTISNPNNVVAWGAMYWQYFENLDKIKTFKATPLTINKKLFLASNTNKGEVMSPIIAITNLKPGDKVKVRIELRVDRDMEFVHMKDMRAAGFEPINVLSGYKYQGGLGYYEMTRDAATNFFFDYLPKGTYVFEYPLFVNHRGDMSNGITTIQCMYAPEFTSHSEGVRVVIGN